MAERYESMIADGKIENAESADQKVENTNTNIKADQNNEEKPSNVISTDPKYSNTILKRVGYQPYSSSYTIINDVGNSIAKGREQEGIDVSYFYRPTVIGFEFKSENPGMIFNTMEQITLTSFWDSREDKDFSTIILGRSHMFYTSEGTPIAYLDLYGKDNEELNVKIPLTQYNPINFLPAVNYYLVNTLQKEELFDDATYVKYKDHKEEYETNTLEKNLNRKNVRRISENHFVISGFNLLFQEIKVNNDVINTVYPVGDFSFFDHGLERNIVSLFDITKNQAQESIVKYVNSFIKSQNVEVPKFLYDGFGASDAVCLAIINEFLSNYLVKQVEYCYSGKIFIKYNPAIEIGDTITLLDETSSTYGIFRVDSFEHSLDTRGLITIVNVKATWDFRDPLLDIYSSKIGNDLIKELGKKIDKSFSNDESNIENKILTPKNKIIQKIMESYLKFLMQSPKYTMLFQLKSGIISEEFEIYKNNSNTPTPVPLRFIPMFVKGKIQMPENLKCVFFDTSKNNYSSFLSNLSISYSLGWRTALNAIYNMSYKVLSFAMDFLLSTYTLGVHEFFKPLFGLSRDKAINSTFDNKDITKTDVFDGEVDSMQSYNPYTGIQNSSKEFSLCFFNIQMMNAKNISQQNNIIDKAIKLKEQFIDSLINERNFNAALIVELYESFKKDDYTYKTFISKFNTYYTVNRAGKKIVCGDGSPFLLNNIDKEYGASIFNQSKNKYYNINSQIRAIPGVDRNVVETIVEYDKPIYDKDKIMYSNVAYGGNSIVSTESMDHRREKMYGAYSDRPYKYKIIWFHNLYGKAKDGVTDADNIAKRINNVRIIIDYYTKEYNSKVKYNNLSRRYEGENIGYIIMADCNLQVYSYGTHPYFTINGGKNEEYMMPKDCPFTQKITRATIINKKTGLTNSNLYDNVLISDNALQFVKAGRIDYDDENKILISDHIPVYIKIDFTNQ